MFSTMMIVSRDQGNLQGSPMSIGQFDARLLTDIGYPDLQVSPSKAAKPRKPSFMDRLLSAFHPGEPQPASLRPANV